MKSMTMAGLGGCREIGRSCFLFQTGDLKLLIDCGLGLDGAMPFVADAVNADDIDAVVLSHAHTDHSGFIPALCAHGFKGPVIATPHTASLSELLWTNDNPPVIEGGLWRRGTEAAHRQWQLLNPGQEQRLKGVSIRFRNAGHLLGSVMVELVCGPRRLLYTGDINYDSGLEEPCMLQADEEFDAVICESTYGGMVRRPRREIMIELIERIEQALARGGSVLIPAFGIGRAQEILLELASSTACRGVPIIVEGETRQANEIYAQASGPSNALNALLQANVFAYPDSDSERDDLMGATGQSIVLSPTGGLEGRSNWYLDRFAANSKNLLALVSFAPTGSTASQLLSGEIAVDMEIARFEFSDHADGPTIERALAKMRARSVYFVHGDEARARVLRDAAAQMEYDQAIIPDNLEEYVLW